MLQGVGRAVWVGDRVGDAELAWPIQAVSAESARSLHWCCRDTAQSGCTGCDRLVRSTSGLARAPEQVGLRPRALHLKSFSVGEVGRALL